YALDGFGALEDDHVVKALADSHPRVRENAVKLAMAKAGESEAVAKALIERADDEDLWVRYQTAFAMGEVVYGKSVPEELIKQPVAKPGGLLLDGPDNQWMRTAALSSLAGHEADLLATHPQTDSAAWGELAGIVARRGRAEELAKVADRVEKEP